MEYILIVWALFGPADGSLAQYEWVAFQTEYSSAEKCFASLAFTEEELVKKENFRGASLECRPSSHW